MPVKEEWKKEWKKKCKIKKQTFINWFVIKEKYKALYSFNKLIIWLTVLFLLYFLLCQFWGSIVNCNILEKKQLRLRTLVFSWGSSRKVDTGCFYSNSDSFVSQNEWERAFLRGQNQFSPVPPLKNLSWVLLVPKMLLLTFFSLSKSSLLSPLGFSNSTTPSEQETSQKGLLMQPNSS